MLDTQIIQNGSVLRTAVIFFYLSNEGISIIENVALTVISTVIAIAIHILLYSSVFSKANLYENIKYSAQDYAIIALLAIGLSIIVQIPFIFTYWFKNVRNIKEGSK